MRRPRTRRWAGHLILWVPVAILAATILAPVRTGDGRPRPPTPEQVFARAFANARYASLLNEADAEFGRGHFVDARRRYEELDRDSSARWFGYGIVRDKIAAAYVAEGDHVRALAAYRHAELLSSNTGRSDDGTRKALMILLAHRRGDEATFARLMGEWERREDSGPALPLAVASSADLTAIRNPAAYRRLGRAFADVSHRAGAEFAYGRALALTDDDPIIRTEWAGFLDRTFHDPKAELRVLRAVAAHPGPRPASFDPYRIERLESEVKDLVKRTLPAELSTERWRRELARERWRSFRGQGAYDPEAHLIPSSDEPAEPPSPGPASGALPAMVDESSFTARPS